MAACARNFGQHTISSECRCKSLCGFRAKHITRETAKREGKRGSNIDEQQGISDWQCANLGKLAPYLLHFGQHAINRKRIRDGFWPLRGRYGRSVAWSACVEVQIATNVVIGKVQLCTHKETALNK